ncbi:MAG: DUF2147 domain-containing protein [Marinifilaceae bacterium]|jgi:uncharacterized protein (DUF2147 family)|nr:DUF2147 domain-containing protein [Marinifilaceae bacterium]
MNKLFLIGLIVLFSSTVFSQSIVGNWKTVDHETGKTESVVKLYIKDNKLYGKIIKLYNSKPGEKKICTNCPKPWNGKPILGLTIINGLHKQKDGTCYKDDGIFSPKKKKCYDCKIWLENNNLYVRGYIGFIYKTQKWIKEPKKNI